MDDRKTSISSYDFCGRIGADTAPIARGVRRSAEVEDEFVVPPLIKPNNCRTILPVKTRSSCIAAMCDRSAKVSPLLCV